eukprot:scaffold100332_cov69-Phaeocystis_antarctica.AAC.6
MAQSASPFAASPSHLPLAAQRQLELELAALRRAVARAFTSLDVGRRKWAAQSESGKRSLSACLNGLTQLAYAEGTHWGALAECTEMRRLVAVRALHKLRAAQAEVDSTLEALAETQRGLAAASATLRDRVEATRSEEAQCAPLFSGCVENSQQFGAPPACSLCTLCHLLPPANPPTCPRARRSGARGRAGGELRAGARAAPRGGGRAALWRRRRAAGRAAGHTLICTYNVDAAAGR